MIFERGTRGNTFSTFPTKNFSFVVDPECVPTLLQAPHRGTLDLIGDLKGADPPVTITLLLPAYLVEPSVRDAAAYVEPLVLAVSDSEQIPPFALSDDILEADRGSLLEDVTEARRALALLALAEAAQADAVVTGNERLVQRRYPLYQYHYIRIVPPSEFSHSIEVCAHGHALFWSATDPNRLMTVDTFYQLNHSKNRRLANWFSRVASTLPNADLRENLRSAILNRYPFILFTRDMIHFYELQMDYYRRRQLSHRFSTPLGYYMMNFYLHLWGMLELLPLIAKQARELEILDRECGIKQEKFWKEFGEKEPGLWAFISSSVIEEWITMMADMRHPAAHGTMPLPTTLVEETEDSRKSDEEIAQILRQEDPEFYSLMPEEMIRVLEPQQISFWRLHKMKILGDNVVVVKRRGTAYVWPPVMSVDADLEMLDSVIDAFLVCLFSRKKG